MGEIRRPQQNIQGHYKARDSMREKNICYDCLIKTGSVPESTKIFIYFCWLWTGLVKKTMLKETFV